MSPASPSPFREIVVHQAEVGLRLDAIVAARMEGVSRRWVKDQIRNGTITVDGHRVKPGMFPEKNSRIVLTAAPGPSTWTPKPDVAVDLDTCFEDEDILVVSKPSGISSVPLYADEGGTVANGVAARFPECAALQRRNGDGGLLHRLDKETSGAVLVARNRETFDALLALQRQGRIEKRYLALVRTTGCIPSAVHTPLVGAGRNGARMKTVSEGPTAHTRLAVLAHRDAWHWVEATISSGVRHQIRAHLASVGAPIVGDRLYDANPCPAGVRRLFLHAFSLSFTHPRTEKKLSIEAPLPNELSKFVEKNLIISF